MWVRHRSSKNALEKQYLDGVRESSVGTPILQAEVDSEQSRTAVVVAAAVAAAVVVVVVEQLP